MLCKNVYIHAHETLDGQVKLFTDELRACQYEADRVTLSVTRLWYSLAMMGVTFEYNFTKCEDLCVALAIWGPCILPDELDRIKLHHVY